MGMKLLEFCMGAWLAEIVIYAVFAPAEFFNPFNVVWVLLLAAATIFGLLLRFGGET